MEFPRHIVTVSGLVTNARDEVLLVRSPRRGWEFPGGQVEEGEDLMTAMVRETEEETGTAIEVGALVGVYSSISQPAKVNFGFLCRYISGDLRTSDESPEVEWVARESALERTLLANQALTLNPSPDRRFAARRGTSKAVFSPSPSVSVREKGPGDEGQNALKSIDQQHLERVTHPAIRDRLHDMLVYDGRVVYRVYQNKPYIALKDTKLTRPDA